MNMETIRDAMDVGCKYTPNCHHCPVFKRWGDNTPETTTSCIFIASGRSDFLDILLEFKAEMIKSNDKRALERFLPKLKMMMPNIR